jgi:Na+-transporting NADH:ubiquinone oxidoreductase subunit C
VKGNLYTVFFAAMLGIVCASLLTFMAEFTKDARLANTKAEEYRNIFAALKVPFDAKASGEELEATYAANITEKPFAEGKKMFSYVSPEAKDKTLATAVKVVGPGLWGAIEGFLALEPDMKTIRGLTFYRQEETPGLGGEIATEDFRSRFVGKSIYDAEGNPGILIKTGKTSELINGINGITGATMTCDKVQDLLNTSIVEIAEAK